MRSVGSGRVGVGLGAMTEPKSRCERVQVGHAGRLGGRKVTSLGVFPRAPTSAVGFEDGQEAQATKVATM